jgi:hypothetical protein
LDISDVCINYELGIRLLGDSVGGEMIKQPRSPYLVTYMAWKVKNYDPIKDYREIAKEYGEEDPLWYCKNCTRETKFGKESIKFGMICSKLHEYKCPYCDQLLTKIKEEDGEKNTV